MPNEAPAVTLAQHYLGYYKAFLRQTGGNAALSRVLAQDMFIAMMKAYKPNSNSALDALTKMWTEDDKEELK